MQQRVEGHRCGLVAAIAVAVVPRCCGANDASAPRGDRRTSSRCLTRWPLGSARQIQNVQHSAAGSQRPTRATGYPVGGKPLHKMQQSANAAPHGLADLCWSALSGEQLPEGGLNDRHKRLHRRH